MKATTRKLLAYKRMGAAVFNRDFKVLEKNEPIEEMLRRASAQAPLDGSDIIELFPEFAGSEPFIHEILDGKVADFSLSYVNRTDANGQTVFWDILVLADDLPNTGVIARPSLKTSSNRNYSAIPRMPLLML